MQSVPKLLSNLQSLSLLQPARADLGPGHLPLVNAGSLPGASVTLCLPYRDDTKRKKKKKKKLLNSLFSNSLPAPEASPRFRGQGAAGGGRGAPGPPPPPPAPGLRLFRASPAGSRSRPRGEPGVCPVLAGGARCRCLVPGRRVGGGAGVAAGGCAAAGALEGAVCSL